jgi:hypothetical protein
MQKAAFLDSSYVHIGEALYKNGEDVKKCKAFLSKLLPNIEIQEQLLEIPYLNFPNYSTNLKDFVIWIGLADVSNTDEEDASVRDYLKEIQMDYPNLFPPETEFEDISIPIKITPKIKDGQLVILHGNKEYSKKQFLSEIRDFVSAL